MSKPKQTKKHWPEATAFIDMVLDRTGLTLAQLQDRYSEQPGIGGSKATYVYKWKRGENRPSFPNVMAVLYAAGMIERPTLDERAASAALQLAAHKGSALAAHPEHRKSHRADQG